MRKEYRDPDIIPFEYITPEHMKCLNEFMNRTCSKEVHAQNVGMSVAKWECTFSVALGMVGAGIYKAKDDRREMIVRFYQKYNEWKAAQEKKPEITMDDPAF